MNLMSRQLLIPLMFALMHTLLLSSFVPPAGKRTALQRSALIAGSVLVQVLIRRFEIFDGLISYLYLAACIGAAFAFFCLWSELSWKAALQRALCYVLLTECVTTILGHFSQKMFGEDIFRTLPVWREILSMGFMGLVNGLLLYVLRHCFSPEALVDSNSLVLSILSAVPYLYAWRITVWLPIAHEAVPISVILTLIASCFLALILIVSLESRLFAEKEKQQAQAMQRVMERQQQQYILRKNNIDQVRRQYHDMKNLLLYLENKPSSENLRSHVKKILGDIHPFETILDTGNEAMDILLSEKLRQCEQWHITCTVIADGGLFSFISPMDMVTIVGNAMDNAIEACLCNPEEERFIQVRTAKQTGFAVLSFSNSCDGQVHAVAGRLTTRKPDRENHGFGLANICRAAQGYNGEVSWSIDEDEFTLTLLFPLTESSV
ncbi:MAG: ATP-binding protein [Faecousia sp.]